MEAVEISASRSRAFWRRAKLSKNHTRDAVVYGVTTGFGKLSDVRIPRGLMVAALNLVRSHACGMGKAAAEPEVRAMMCCAQMCLRRFPAFGSRSFQMLGECLIAAYTRSSRKRLSWRKREISRRWRICTYDIGEGEAFLEGERMESSERCARKITPHTWSQEGLAY